MFFTRVFLTIVREALLTCHCTHKECPARRSMPNPRPSDSVFGECRALRISFVTLCIPTVKAKRFYVDKTLKLHCAFTQLYCADNNQTTTEDNWGP